MDKQNIDEQGGGNTPEYSGNIWGWKFSFISLGIIVAMLLLMLYRYSVVKNSSIQSDKQDMIMENDSSKSKNTVD